MRAMHGIAFRWAGMGADDVLVFHVGISNSASHGPFHRGIRALGRLPYLVGHLGFEKRLELMQRLGMDHMYVMPSALNGLTQLIDEQGTTPRELFPALRSIMMSGEGWPVDFVERMEEAWGAPIYEGYGASQTYAGFIMSNCEHGAVTDGRRNGMHVYEWAAIIEVVDPGHARARRPGRGGRDRRHAPREGGVAADPLPHARPRRLPAVAAVHLRPPARHDPVRARSAAGTTW